MRDRLIKLKSILFFLSYTFLQIWLTITDQATCMCSEKPILLQYVVDINCILHHAKSRNPHIHSMTTTDITFTVGLQLTIIIIND